MSDAKIILSAVDQSAAAFRSMQSGLTKLGRQASAVGSTFRILGSVSGAVLAVDLIKKVVEAGDAMETLAQKSGLSVEKISALKYAAEQSETSVDDLAMGIKKMGVAMGQQPEAFAAIGVAVKDTAGHMRAVDDVMMDVADVFKTMPEGAERTALAVKLLGKSGDALIPFLSQGSAGIKALRLEAEKLGVVMSGNFAKTANQVSDNFVALGAKAKGLAQQGFTPVLRGILGVTEGLKALAQTGDLGALKLILSPEPVRSVDELRAHLELLAHEMETAANDDAYARASHEHFLTLIQIGEAEKKAAADRVRVHTDTDVRLIALLDRETNQIRQILASQVEAYKEATAQVGHAREERNRIEADNATYMARIRSGGARKADEVTPSDVIALQAAMRESVQARNFTQAIQQGEEAKKLIDDIVQSGTRSAGYMESFASAVVTLQNQAAQAQQDAAQQRVADIQKVFSETLAKAEALTRVKVSFDTAGAQQAMDQLMAILQAQLAGRALNVPVIPVSADAIKAIGTGTNPTIAPGTLDIGGTLYPPLPMRAGGGLISGPSTGVSDSVLMRASAGEWVMRAAAVRHYGPALMGAINSLRLPRFAAGGPVGGGDTFNLTWPSGRTTQFSGAPGVSAQVRREFALEALRMGRRG